MRRLEVMTSVTGTSAANDAFGPSAVDEHPVIAWTDVSGIPVDLMKPEPNTEVVIVLQAAADAVVLSGDTK